MADDIKPDTDSGYRRAERGVITKAQTKGLEFARTANIDPQGGGVWMVNDAIVQFERNSCNCDWYQRSRPRTRCADWWAVAYTVDP
ncbi:MAG TPA: hypothetical protein VGT98_07135, partial [Candidatus Elarobacter sp.]|nr:hypothetical protein [Candidatus Elarobacter sp.]